MHGESVHGSFGELVLIVSIILNGKFSVQCTYGCIQDPYTFEAGSQLLSLVLFVQTKDVG